MEWWLGRVLWPVSGARLSQTVPRSVKWLAKNRASFSEDDLCGVSAIRHGLCWGNENRGDTLIVPWRGRTRCLNAGPLASCGLTIGSRNNTRDRVAQPRLTRHRVDPIESSLKIYHMPCLGRVAEPAAPQDDMSCVVLRVRTGLRCCTATHGYGRCAHCLGVVSGSPAIYVHDGPQSPVATLRAPRAQRSQPSNSLSAEFPSYSRSAALPIIFPQRSDHIKFPQRSAPIKFLQRRVSIIFLQRIKFLQRRSPIIFLLRRVWIKFLQRSDQSSAANRSHSCRAGYPSYSCSAAIKVLQRIHHNPAANPSLFRAGNQWPHSAILACGKNRGTFF